MATLTILRKGLPLAVLLDDEDLPLAAPHTWYACGGGYVRTKIDGKTVLLHRFLLSPPKGVQVDHANGNRLDNRRANLRLVNNQKNQENRRGATSANLSSGIRGVCYDIRHHRWKAHVQSKGKKYNRYFGSKEEAASWAAAMRKELGFLGA